MFLLGMCNAQIYMQGLSTTNFRFQTSELVRITLCWCILSANQYSYVVELGTWDSRYTVARITEEKEWIRVVEFACGLFFVVDYLIKVYR